MFAYLENEIVYPEEAKKDDVEGKVFVSFVIDKEGRVTEAEVIRGIHPILDKKALNVVEEMPDWIPAKVKGKKMNMQYNLPISFKLSD